MLTADGHDSAAHHLTGPETLTQAAQVRVIGAVPGRDVRREDLPPGQARRQMLAGGRPESFADAALAAWAAWGRAGAGDRHGRAARRPAR